jgi:hypothetical protein
MQNTSGSNALELPREDDAQFSSALRSVAIAEHYAEIDCVELYELASSDYREVAAIWDKLEERRTSITKPINEALRNTNALFKPVMDRVEAAKKAIGARMQDWTARERRRIAAETLAREALAREERERLAAAAKVASDAGRDEEAFALRQTVELVAAPPIRVEVPKTEGLVSRQNWSAEVLDLVKLVRFVAARPEFIGLLQANQTALNQTARTHKGALEIDGVRFVDKGGFARK